MFAAELRTINDSSGLMISVDQIVVSNESLKAIGAALVTMAKLRELLVSQGFHLVSVNTNQAHFLNHKKGISAFFTMVYSPELNIHYPG